MTFHNSRSIYLIIAFVTILFGSCAQPFDFDFEDAPEDAPDGAPTDPDQIHQILEDPRPLHSA